MKFKHPSVTAENLHEGPQHRDILPNLNEADVRCSVLEDSPPEAPSYPILVNRESLWNKAKGYLEAQILHSWIKKENPWSFGLFDIIQK